MSDQALQSISITRSENRSTPTPHVVYAILISLPVRSWTVFRRYSEFLTLQQAFLDLPSVLGPPPASLPPKNSTRSTINAITGLGGLVPRGNHAKEEDERLREDRRKGLELYLRAIISSPDRRWRESDEFRSFIEMPKGQSTVTLLDSNATSRTRYVPGSYANNHQNVSSNSRSPLDSYSNVRKLGASNTNESRPVHESQTTRILDDRSLLNSQQAQMDAQDRQLDGLAAILRRQKQMGLAINQELTEQSELIQDLDDNVDRTQNKMRSAEKQMEKLR